MPELSDIEGIGPAGRNALHAAHIDSVDQLLARVSTAQAANNNAGVCLDQLAAATAIPEADPLGHISPAAIDRAKTYTTYGISGARYRSIAHLLLIVGLFGAAFAVP